MDAKDRISLLEDAKFLALFDKKYDEAIFLVDRLLSERDNDIDALRLKGNILDLKALDISLPTDLETNKGFFSEAKKCYEKILEIDQNNALAMIDLGDYWAREDNYSVALKWYDNAIHVLENGIYHSSLEEEMEEAVCKRSELIESHKLNDKMV